MGTAAVKGGLIGVGGPGRSYHDFRLVVQLHTYEYIRIGRQLKLHTRGTRCGGGEMSGKSDMQPAKAM